MIEPIITKSRKGNKMDDKELKELKRMTKEEIEQVYGGAYDGRLTKCSYCGKECYTIFGLLDHVRDSHPNVWNQN